MKNYEFQVNNDHKEYYLNGQRHNENGPAVIIGDDYQAWYINGQRHNENGPAYINGDCQEWWLNDKEYSEEEFNAKMKI